MVAWSTVQLTELFSAIARAGETGTALRIAVDRATEATESEVAAVLTATEVLASVGLGRRPERSVFAGLTPASDVVTFPGTGPMYVTVLMMDRREGGSLVVARRDEPFAAEERQILQGMARVLGLALRSLQTLETERELRREREHEAETRLGLVQALERRERLLETLLQVQRAAHQRAPL